ncbi:MAG: hypothetical protein AAF571_03980 [Verrucomicrobiota bacterium]
MKTNTNQDNQDYYLAQEAIAMMENGRPTPMRQKRLLIEGLTRDFTATYIHFGTNGTPLKPGTAQ